MHQMSLALITRKINHSPIEQRATDGYINATAMCKAAGKLLGHYRENTSTKAFLQALETDIGIPISKLIQSVRGGPEHLQGTWVHPQAAIHLAQWLSPKFAVQVSKWVVDWMSGKQSSHRQMPYHIERHMLNAHKIPKGYFSVLQEMTLQLVAPLEAHGYILPENMVPDISQAKMLCKHLRDKHRIDTQQLPKYQHAFPDGRLVRANLYPMQYLSEFRLLMDDVWMPQRAERYFRERAPDALPAIDRYMRLASPAKALH